MAKKTSLPGTRKGARATPAGGVVHARLVKDSSVIRPAILGLGAAGGGGGGADKFVDNGGTVLQVAQVFLIYLGNAWAAMPAQRHTAAQSNRASREMIGRAY